MSRIDSTDRWQSGGCYLYDSTDQWVGGGVATFMIQLIGGIGGNLAVAIFMIQLISGLVAV
jgi:hypothetical protein